MWSFIKEFGPSVFRWLRNRFRGKQILILGAGGVGKTTLAELLGEKMSMLKVRTKYEESIDTDVYKVKGALKATIFVVAGQSHRRDATWGEHLASVCPGMRVAFVFVWDFEKKLLEDSTIGWDGASNPK